MKPYFILSLILALLTACNSTQKPQLQSGDIVFVGSTGSALGGAIDAVTQTKKQTHFTHMGIIEMVDGKAFVLHSNSYKGVCREPIDSFKKRNVKDGDSAFVYRIQDLSNEQVSNALNKAHSLIGQPYNNTYIFPDTGFYCSEYVYTAFAQDSIFELNPMTFKDPETSEFHPIWQEHYHQLGIEIPEGLPGCNPNGMAANNRLVFVGSL
ncbi:MAG: hypothetical protein KDC92_05065 [Bacteroidetes bacterium]|nr:hypothetical protein [Bacteroidota bacterium]